jgi:6-phosphogluconolactonase
MKNNLHIFKTPEEVAVEFANQMMNWIQESTSYSFHIAISGGKTPDLLFSVLAEKQANSELWQKVHFWWVDERMVAPEEPDSNYGVAHKLLFSKISIPEENIHRIKGENTPGMEALSYSSEIQEKLPSQNGWPVFDLILLGMGDDGHTASIFPDQMELLNSTHICAVAVHPQSGQKRVTLTGKAINNARKVCFLVTGKEKAAGLSEIFNETSNARLLPAFYIKNALWIVDQASSRLIE